MMEAVTTGAPGSYNSGEIHYWTDLLDSFDSCNMQLNGKIMRVTNFILYLIIFVGGLVGNLLVLCVNWQSRKSWSGINIYILNMALADLGVVLSLPIWMLEMVLEYIWLWGDFLCGLTHYFYFVNMYASIFFLTALSVDRYLSTVSTSLFWHQHHKQIRKGLCIAIWVLAAILPLPEVVHYEMDNYSAPVCSFLPPSDTYSHWFFATRLLAITLGFLIPFLIIAGANILTANYIKSSRIAGNKSECRLIYGYIIVFFVSWFPYHSMLTYDIFLVFDIDISCNALSVLHFLYAFTKCVSFLHCMVNPILYNFLSKNFQKQLITAVVKYTRKEQPVNIEGKQATPTTSHSIIITKANLQENSLTNDEVEQDRKSLNFSSTATYL